MRWNARTIIRILKSPITAISKAIDHYGKCMINFSDSYHRPFIIREAAPNPPQLRRGVISTQATSAVTATQVMSNPSIVNTSEIWPSPSLSTIHEDRTCSFRNDDVVCKKKLTNRICFVVKSVCY